MLKTTCCLFFSSVGSWADNPASHCFIPGVVVRAQAPEQGRGNYNSGEAAFMDTGETALMGTGEAALMGTGEAALMGTGEAALKNQVDMDELIGWFNGPLDWTGCQPSPVCPHFLNRG